MHCVAAAPTTEESLALLRAKILFPQIGSAPASNVAPGASLNAVLSGIDSESVVVRESGNQSRQTVLYRLSK